MKLIASRPLTYATRRLKAGDPFTARSEAHRRILIVTKRATAAPDDGDPIVTKAGTSANLDALRAEYLKVFDKRPYHGWDAEALTAKIAEEIANS